MSGDAFDERAIAIVGMAGRFPGAPDLEAFWRLVAEGRDAITRFEADGSDEAGLAGAGEGEAYVRARGVLDGVETFDAGFFDVTPAEAAQLDPQHRVFLEVAWEALESAGYARDGHGQVVSVYAGSFPGMYLLHNLLPDRAAVEEYVRMRRARTFALLVQNDPAFLPSRTAYKLDLRGPAINVQTACSTSLVAVSMAVQGLLAYEADMALAGGVCIAVPQRSGYFFQEGSLHSRDGTCRPYDAAACGTVFGNGAGAVVLKRLADARRDRDPVLAIIRGAAVNNDGRGKVSYSAPSVQGQAEVIAAAQALAGVEAGTIGYVEGHGTATPMGDPIEVEALKLAFRQAAGARCCLGSVKGNIGHLDAAAGIAGLLRAVLALRHRQLPATAHFQAPNPELRLDGSPFYVASRTAPWPEGPHPRRAGVSSFGIGGTNAHVVLEEAPPLALRPRDPAAPEPTTLLLSARTPAALDAATGRLAAWIEEQCRGGRAPRPLSEVAAALKARRRLHGHRRAVRVASWADAGLALRDPARWDTGAAVEGRPRLVFAFPGQGSLQAGALAPLLAAEPSFDAELASLAEPASRLAGFDLLAWARDPVADPEPLRRDNARAQLAVFCIDVALARWLEARGVRADGFVGHSLGEWAGACLAGVLAPEEALAAVHERGRLMQETGPGAALSVRLSEEAVAPYLEDGVALACVNGPQLCLLSGRPEAIRRCAARLAAAGAVARPVPIDVAVHSPLMDPVVEALGGALRPLGWRPPSRALLSPVTGRWLAPEEASDPGYWASQARRTVRFDAAVATLLEEPSCVVLEVGLGDALTSLVRPRIRDARRQRALPLLGKLADGAAHAADRLQRARSELWAVGVAEDELGAPDLGAEAATLPTYPFERQRHWREAPVADASSRQADEAAPAAAAPRPASGVREQLLDLIEELSGIGRSQLDPAQPFSSLGLDSLLLVQLAEALSARFGRPIGFAQLGRLNTVERLAAELQGALPAAAPASPPPASLAAGFRGLFPIRKGDGRLPMLLVHGDIGNDLLPPWLPEEQTIHGYAHQGSDGEPIELRSVEALARRCFDEWSAAEPGKACIVAGHSFGGLVAQQVAHLLRQSGVRVELLILFDVAHPRCFENPFPAGWRRVRRAVRHQIDAARFRADVLRGDLTASAGRRVPLRWRTPYILGVYELAVRRYAPPVLDAEALLFRATASPWPSNGWRPEEFRRLEIESVVGDHLSIVRDRATFAPIGQSVARRVGELRRRLGER